MSANAECHNWYQQIVPLTETGHREILREVE